MRAIATIVLVLLFSVAVPAHAGILVGAPPDPGVGNCFPFGCVGGTSTVYQQVYNANNFPGSITITGLTFFHTQVNGGDNNLNTGTYTISLSTTSKAVNGLDLVDFNNNDGPDNTLFFSSALPASVAFGASFTLSGIPFTYNPANGNLLVDMRISGIGHTGAGLFLDDRFQDAGTIFSRAHNFGTVFDSTGLVTQFETGQAAVPEPATLSLLAIGALGLGLLRRRTA